MEALTKSSRPNNIRSTNKHTIAPARSNDFSEHLPVEIMREIFVYCLGNDIMDEFPSLRTAPLKLCMVSWRWRTIAMQIPTLWQSFSMAPPQGIDKSVYISIVALFIKLSGRRPLNFKAWTTVSVDQQILAEVFPLVLFEINRWQEVSIVLSEDFCKRFVGVTVGDNPLLENLTLDAISCYGGEKQVLPNFFQKFTRLRRLYLYDNRPMVLFDTMWSRLTQIYIDADTSIDNCVEILKKCSQVVQCTMLNITEPLGHMGTYVKCLSYLTDLHLKPLYDAGDIFSRLRCPALAYLVIDYNPKTRIQNPNTLWEFLSRSSRKLETFHLINGGVTEKDFMDYMLTQALRSVTSLRCLGLKLSEETWKNCMHECSGTTNLFMPLIDDIRLYLDGVPYNIVASLAERDIPAELRAERLLQKSVFVDVELQSCVSKVPNSN